MVNSQSIRYQNRLYHHRMAADTKPLQNSQQSLKVTKRSRNKPKSSEGRILCRQCIAHSVVQCRIMFDGNPEVGIRRCLPGNSASCIITCVVGTVSVFDRSFGAGELDGPVSLIEFVSGWSSRSKSLTDFELSYDSIEISDVFLFRM